MVLPGELGDFIKHSIDDTLGLPIPDSSLQSKLQSLETSNYNLRSQCLNLQSKLKEKEAALALSKAEASINALSIKKFVVEKQILEMKCVNLIDQAKKLDEECRIYSRNREDLFNLKKEAEERAKAAEIKVKKLEQALKQVSEELELCKFQPQIFAVDSSKECSSLERVVQNGLLGSLLGQTDVKKVESFLEDNRRVEFCGELLILWKRLRPETQNILSLTAQLQSLKREREHLRNNLQRVTEEVSWLSKEMKFLVDENKRLFKQCESERKHVTKISKRKTSSDIWDSVEKAMKSDDSSSPKSPVSHRGDNSLSSESRTH